MKPDGINARSTIADSNSAAGHHVAEDAGRRRLPRGDVRSMWWGPVMTPACLEPVARAELVEWRGDELVAADVVHHCKANFTVEAEPTGAELEAR